MPISNPYKIIISGDGSGAMPIVAVEGDFNPLVKRYVDMALHTQLQSILSEKKRESSLQELKEKIKAREERRAVTEREAVSQQKLVEVKMKEEFKVKEEKDPKDKPTDENKDKKQTEEN
jgi:uncharacterized membrane protein YukC